MKYCFGLLLSIVLAMAACKKTDSNFTSRISLLNAAIGAGTFTVKANDAAIIGKIPFDSLQLYTSVGSGTYKIGFYRDAIVNPDITFTTNLESGENYTCFTFDSAQQYAIFFQKDVLPSTVTENKCAIRFFSLIPNSTGISIQNDTGKVLLRDQAFKMYSNTFEETDTTSLRLKLKMNGRIATLDSLYNPLTAGKIYTIFLTGSLGAVGVQQPKTIIWQHN